MKKAKVNFFKIFIVICMLGFLFCCYQYSQTGRFQLSNDGYDVIDTHTGKVYKKSKMR